MILDVVMILGLHQHYTEVTIYPYWCLSWVCPRNGTVSPKDQAVSTNSYLQRWGPDQINGSDEILGSWGIYILEPDPDPSLRYGIRPFLWPCIISLSHIKAHNALWYMEQLKYENNKDK